MREPNFFIVGTLKAGTTSLHRYLDQHPDIYMSPMKEPCYFWQEMRPENWAPSQRARAYRSLAETQKYLRGPMDKQCSGGIVCEWDDYLKLFAAATTSVPSERPLWVTWCRRVRSPSPYTRPARAATL